MAHVFQVGAGSGGMPVLDLLARDASVSRVTLVEPDVYKSHNVIRHSFPESAVGRLKSDLAAEWLRDRRPDLEINVLSCDLLDPVRQGEISEAIASCDIGVCAADNEPAKYHFDLLMRRAGKPWTLGEVLSGGIGGFVHGFVPGGPCYGCVASHLQRAVVVDSAKAPDYSQPGGPVEEAAVPASKASITTIAGLHAVLTLELLANLSGYDPGFTTMLLTLKRVPGVFEEPFRPFRFRIPRAAECLICRAEESPTAVASEDLDVALDQALRAWAMHDLWHLYRTGPQSQALAYSFEKAGLTLHNQPIPWNAEAVLVEAQLHAKDTARRKTDYELRLAGRPDPVPADSLRRDDADGRYRLFFRFPPPHSTTTAELLWKGHTLGQLTLPLIDAPTFVAGLRLQLPTLSVRLGEQTVACQTFVATQCKGLVASAILVSPTSLAPLADLGLHVEFRSERDGSVSDVPVPLCSSQLAGRQAVLTAVPPRFPRRLGAWTATWKVDDQLLATHRVRAISQKTFLRSLRVSDTRFVIETKAGVTLRRQPPGPGEAVRVGPCFLVSSREPGMAGMCKLQVHAQVPGDVAPPLLLEQALLVTDGPTIYAPGTVDATDLHQVTTFDLRHKGELLGVLSLCPVPTANFTAEGGFKAPTDFTWTPTAEEELGERLSKLMDGPKG